VNYGLTDAEWQDYIDCVNTYVAAKRSKDWPAADVAREQLYRWQHSTPDGMFFEMVDSGEYLWSSMFEETGEGSHRYLRLMARERGVL
jgi:hypothetical protein